jgi:hypothetical protein
MRVGQCAGFESEWVGSGKDEIVWFRFGSRWCRCFVCVFVVSRETLVRLDLARFGRFELHPSIIPLGLHALCAARDAGQTPLVFQPAFKVRACIQRKPRKVPGTTGQHSLKLLCIHQHDCWQPKVVAKPACILSLSSLERENRN